MDKKGNLLDQQPAYDKLINFEITMQVGDRIQHRKVTGRSYNPEGNIIGVYNDNPRLNNHTYDVEFNDRSVREYEANIIAENMISQVDKEGYSMIMLDNIIDYMKDPQVAVSKEDSYVITRRGTKRQRKSSARRKILIRWKDNSETWVPLKDLKELYPVELEEFARARGIDLELAFAWWVPYTLRKRDVILSSVKKMIWKTTHKYRVEIPTSIEHAYEIHARNNNYLWRDTIRKEIMNVIVAFELLRTGKKAPL